MMGLSLFRMSMKAKTKVFLQMAELERRKSGERKRRHLLNYSEMLETRNIMKGMISHLFLLPPSLQCPGHMYLMQRGRRGLKRNGLNIERFCSILSWKTFMSSMISALWIQYVSGASTLSLSRLWLPDFFTFTANNM